MKHIITFSLLTALLFGCAVRGSRNQISQKSYGGSFGPSVSQKIQEPNMATSAQLETDGHTEETLGNPVPTTLSLPVEQKIQKRKLGFILQKQANQYPQDSTTKSNDKLPIEKNAKIGFWLAIGGIISSFIPYVQFLSFFALIAALILGIVGRKNINENPGKYRGYGLATAAIIIPIIYIVLALLVILILIAVLASGF